MGLFVDFGHVSTNSALGSLVDGETDLVVRVPLLLTLQRSIVCYAVFDGEGSADHVAALCDEDSVTSTRVIDRPANAVLASIELPRRSGSVLEYIADSNVKVIEAVGTSEEWVFRLRCPDYGTLQELGERCEESNHRVRVERVYEPAGDETLLDGALTPQQEVALRTARGAGYFRVPREASLSELSDELNISDSAVSQRLRRGIDTLLAMLFEDTERGRR